jgi:hypothetical protein
VGEFVKPAGFGGSHYPDPVGVVFPVEDGPENPCLKVKATKQRTSSHWFVVFESSA